MRLAALFASAILPMAVFSAALSGCQASVEGKVNVGAKGEIEDFDKPIDKSTAEAAPEEALKDVALLGSRQDLSFKGPSTAACKCLEVALGQPTDRAFQWAGERPKTSHDGQLVIAVNSTGIACPALAGKPGPGASYWGYEVVGNDVVVVVERQAAGRPVAAGAIIPRPTGTGQVFVRPADKDLPYGRPINGAGDRCQIGKLDPVAPAVTGTRTEIGGQQVSPFSAEAQSP